MSPVVQVETKDAGMQLHSLWDMGPSRFVALCSSGSANAVLEPAGTCVANAQTSQISAMGYLPWELFPLTATNCLMVRLRPEAESLSIRRYNCTHGWRPDRLSPSGLFSVSTARSPMCQTPHQARTAAAWNKQRLYFAHSTSKQTHQDSPLLILRVHFLEAVHD